MRAQTASPGRGTKPLFVRAPASDRPTCRSMMSCEPSGFDDMGLDGHEALTCFLDNENPSGRTPRVRFPFRAQRQRAGPRDSTENRSTLEHLAPTTRACPASSETVTSDMFITGLPTNCATNMLDRTSVDLMRAADLLQHTFVHNDNAIGRGTLPRPGRGSRNRCRACLM